MSAKSRRILVLLNDPKHPKRLAIGINLLDQDEPAQVSKEQEMKVLKEMNELQGSPTETEDAETRIL